MQRAIEDLDVPVMLIGPDLRVAFANQRLHALLGFAAGDLRGLPMNSLLGPHRQGELRNFEQLLQGGSSRRLRSVLRRHDGRPAQVSLMLSPCLDDAGHIAAVTVRVDAPEAGSAAASAAALHSRPPEATAAALHSRPPEATAAALHSRPPEAAAGGTVSSWPPAVERGSRSETLPEIPPLDPLPSVTAGGLQSAAPRTARGSEHRLSHPGEAPSEAVLAELGGKLHALSQRVVQLQTRLRVAGTVPDADVLAALMRTTEEMRDLLERARELEQVMTERRERVAPA